MNAYSVLFSHKKTWSFILKQIVYNEAYHVVVHIDFNLFYIHHFESKEDYRNVRSFHSMLCLLQKRPRFLP